MIDKEKLLSPELIEKQKAKGTYDSVCLSVCDYEGEQLECQTCGMLKEEKRAWKVASPEHKSFLMEKIKRRRDYKTI